MNDDLTGFAVVCSGPSLAGYKLEFAPHVTVIAVNGGYTQCVNPPDYWFTLDPSKRNLDRLEDLPIETEPIMALPPRLSELGDNLAPRLLTLLVDHSVNVWKRVTGDGHGRYRTKPGISENYGEIHTGNSGTGAIQVAAHMGAKRIAIFGMDGRGGYAGGVDRPNDLSPLPDLCDGLKRPLDARGIEVRNCSPDSIIRAWDRLSVEDGLEWINER